MTKIESFLFDWTNVSDLMDNWNVKFKLSEMGVANKFQLVLSSYAYDTINECLTDGKLNGNVNVFKSVDCALNWSDNALSLKDDVVINIGDVNVPLKALFLRHKESGYVLGYSININSFDVTNELVFDKGTMFLSFVEGDLNG